MKEQTLGIKRLHASKNEGYAAIPPWLIVMCNSMFFTNCMVHPNTRKNELDRFCIDCLTSLCTHCLSAHTRHKCVKIRRYVYSEVINRQDLNKLFNCSGIQTYHTNKTKVLFLKQRNQQQQQSQQINSKDSSCIICDRNLQDNSLYCSIACKVVALFEERNREKTNNMMKEEENDKDCLTPSSPNISKQKRSRKGIPLRAPIM